MRKKTLINIAQIEIVELVENKKEGTFEVVIHMNSKRKATTVHSTEKEAESLIFDILCGEKEWLFIANIGNKETQFPK